MEQTLFNFREILSAFVVLFAIIDIPGLIPIIIDYKKSGHTISGTKTSIYSLCVFIAFLFLGEAILKLFHVDVESFAVAGALVIFILAFEMIFGVKIFKIDAPSSAGAFVPIVFPLIAGAGSFTTLISLRALYSLPNILVALLANIIVIYFAIRFVSVFEKLLGDGGIYIARKLFGVILLAISVRMFMDNIYKMILSLN